MHIAQPMLQKLKELGYKVLFHLSYSLELSTMDYHLFMHLINFFPEKGFYNQQDAENAFQEFVALIFTLQV